MGVFNSAPTYSPPAKPKRKQAGGWGAHAQLAKTKKDLLVMTTRYEQLRLTLHVKNLDLIAENDRLKARIATLERVNKLLWDEAEAAKT
jgi:hypothetical protein